MRRRSMRAPDSCVQRTASDTVATAPDIHLAANGIIRPLSGSGSALGIGQNHLADRNRSAFFCGKFVQRNPAPSFHSDRSLLAGLTVRRSSEDFSPQLLNLT